MILKWEAIKGGKREALTPKTACSHKGAEANFGVFLLVVNSRTEGGREVCTVDLYCPDAGFARYIRLTETLGNLLDGINAAETLLFSEQYRIPSNNALITEHHAKERIVVFLCEECGKELRSGKKVSDPTPYTNGEDKPILHQRVIHVNVPKESCEKHGGNNGLAPILLDSRTEYRVSEQQRNYLLKRFLDDVDPWLYTMQIEVFRDEDAKNNGDSDIIPLEPFLDTVQDPDYPAEEIIQYMAKLYTAGGAAELVVCDDDHTYCVYHQEMGNEYVTRSLFNDLV